MFLYSRSRLSEITIGVSLSRRNPRANIHLCVSALSLLPSSFARHPTAASRSESVTFEINALEKIHIFLHNRTIVFHTMFKNFVLSFATIYSHSRRSVRSRNSRKRRRETCRRWWRALEWLTENIVKIIHRKWPTQIQHNTNRKWLTNSIKFEKYTSSCVCESTSWVIFNIFF